MTKLTSSHAKTTPHPFTRRATLAFPYWTDNAVPTPPQSALPLPATIVKGLAAANASDGEPIEQRHEQLRELEPARVGAAPELRAGVRVVGRRRME